MRTRLALLLVLLLPAACDNDSPTSPVDGFSFETLAQASFSGFSQRELRAVRSQSEWAQVWETAHAGVGAKPALPAVDFGRETVMLAAAGTRPDGCYSIEIAEIRSTGNGGIELEVTETVPGPTCVCIQVVTQPLHLVRVVPRPVSESFVERSFELAC